MPSKLYYFFLQQVHFLYLQLFYINLEILTASLLKILHCIHKQKNNPLEHPIKQHQTIPTQNISIPNTINMLASRAAKPKLSLSISTAVPAQAARPTLALKSPVAPLRSPISPSPMSPTARNTRLNQRGYSTMQQPTYTYVNSSSSRSILKKASNPTSTARRQLSFSDTPIVYCVTPIEEEDYYGTHTKMSKEERRWQRK